MGSERAAGRLLLAAALLAGGCSGARKGDAPFELAPAPQFALSDLEGKPAGSSDFRGKVVVLDLWATWCDPCRASMPFFEDLSRRYRSRGVEVIGANEDGDKDDVARYARERGVTYRILLDPSKTLLRDLDVGELPATFVIDARGLVRGRWTGFDRENAEAIEAALKNVLSGK